MLAERRHDEIMRLVTQHGSLSLRDLVRQLDVSEATVRRDVTVLAEAGRLLRVYGGVVSHGTEDLSFALSDTTDRAEKHEIARAAASFVRDGDTVILDIGSSVLELARVLRGRDITVVTGNMMVYDVMKDHPATEIVLLGGALRRNYWATSGHLAAQTLSGLHADIAFLGTSGLTPQGQMLDTTADDVIVKQQALVSADRSVLLATERKFPGDGRHVVCDAAQLTAVVTSYRTGAASVAELEAHGVTVVRAGKQPEIQAVRGQ